MGRCKVWLCILLHGQPGARRIHRHMVVCADQKPYDGPLGDLTYQSVEGPYDTSKDAEVAMSNIYLDEAIDGV